MIQRNELVKFLRQGFALDWQGVHGVRHWARVKHNGLQLARETGADPHVVELFAWFHDAGRVSERTDHGHGTRGFEIACKLRGTLFDATDAQFALLRAACIGHSDGGMIGNPTVLTCWDADRADLGRVGITPSTDLLATEAARRPAFLTEAHRRALASIPKAVHKTAAAYAWHYTHYSNAYGIREKGLIPNATFNEYRRGVVWFSKRQDFEPAALSFYGCTNAQEAAEKRGGLIRFGLPQDDKRLMPWTETSKYLGLTLSMRKGHELMARRLGSPCGNYLTAKERIPRADLLAQTWAEGQWVDVERHLADFSALHTSSI